MTQKRTLATATPLADGRILIAGGAASAVAHVRGVDYHLPTNTAEIFDPKTNSFTPVASMNTPRCGHAAILLPTGQVLAVGGYSLISNLRYDEASNETFYTASYPTETELYDPDTNTWHVMDDLGYGLDNPKLALQPDGNVFITGIQVTSDAPAAHASLARNGKLKAANRGMNAAASLASNTSLLWNVLFGTVATVNTRVDAYPEEAALILNGLNLIPVLSNGTPSLARISVPLPSSINPPQAQPDLQIGVNQLARYFMLKIQKPTADAEIIGIRATLVAGAQNQVVTGTDNGFQGLAAGVFERVQTRGDVTYQNAAGTDERTTEDLRKNWLQTWLPAQVPGPQDPARLTEYYRVRVTFAAGNLANIRYGVIDGNNVAPPSDTLAYTFRIQYRVAGEVRECDVTTHGTVRAHWSTAQFFQNHRYGGWNSDKWVLASVWNWMSIQANRDQLEPVNDFTLEHGRNTGHGKEHLRGDGIDMFHPGYASYRNAQGTLFVLDMNVDDGEGGRFRDALIGDLQIARSGDPQTQVTQGRRIALVSPFPEFLPPQPIMAVIEIAATKHARGAEL
ncbi:MAG: hypothetical protein HYR61_11350 [Acidobacteria bacterium]|nr:hypothetical protein [Acidobacteriota bacterium]